MMTRKSELKSLLEKKMNGSLSDEEVSRGCELLARAELFPGKGCKTCKKDYGIVYKSVYDTELCFAHAYIKLTRNSRNET